MPLLARGRGREPARSGRWPLPGIWVPARRAVCLCQDRGKKGWVGRWGQEWASVGAALRSLPSRLDRLSKGWAG